MFIETVNVQLTVLQDNGNLYLLNNMKSKQELFTVFNAQYSVIKQIPHKITKNKNWEKTNLNEIPAYESHSHSKLWTLLNSLLNTSAYKVMVNS